MRSWPAALVLVGLGAQARTAEAPLPQSLSSQIELGQSVFRTQWAPTGTPEPNGRIGVGPLFNANSCNACHEGGDRGSGPAGAGPAPKALVFQLELRPTNAAAESQGDPVYGRVFNTSAIDGERAEGSVTIHYREVAGYYYPFGGQWSLRVPRYELVGLTRGPLAQHTVIKPRIAPALFGIGLLAAVPDSAITNGDNSLAGEAGAGTVSWVMHRGARVPGRLGWQCGAATVREQAASALAGEMGLTSDERSGDDCTLVETDCYRYARTDAPEVPAELLDAVVAYVETLGVPASSALAEKRGAGFALFEETGCTGCHRPTLPVEGFGDAAAASGNIAAYTDLRLHDLGMDMADEDSSGVRIPSKWRTAPLWRLAHREQQGVQSTFLHDGRARSVEEAILWHGGEAAYAKRKFTGLGPRAREALLQWLTTL